MSWWKRFWDEKYLSQLIAREKNTKKEINFILNVMNVPKGSKILDLACGIGRHSIELAKRGYRVLGIDFSKTYIDYAKRKSRELSLDIKFVRRDMRKFNFKEKFDAVICIFTSFGYFSDKDNFGVLKRVNSVLRPNGRFVIDVINRDALLKNFSPIVEFKTNYGKMIERTKFDHASNRLHGSWTFYKGKKEFGKMKTSLRTYSHRELKSLLKKAGFTVLKSYSGFGKERMNSNARRLIVVCKK